MADIEKFTGYKAIDGSTHKTAKAAILHTREVKIKTALASTFKLPIANATGVTELATGERVVFGQDVPDFLYANRDAISAAFKQDVSLRAPRTKKAKPAGVAAPPVSAGPAAGSTEPADEIFVVND